MQLAIQGGLRSGGQSLLSAAEQLLDVSSAEVPGLLHPSRKVSWQPQNRALERLTCLILSSEHCIAEAEGHGDLNVSVSGEGRAEQTHRQLGPPYLLFVIAEPPAAERNICRSRSARHFVVESSSHPISKSSEFGPSTVLAK
jgi:hypothetical protein